MSRAEGERTSSLVAALAAALITATCSRASHLEPKAAAPVVTKAPPAPASAAPAAPAPPASSAPAAVPAPAPADTLALPQFYAALAGLETGARRDHARILWLGDSHTAADYITGAVRRRLGQRFGVGGPGFIRVGLASYRHGGVKIVRDGRFRIEPEPPSRRSSEGDTAFGFGGLRATPADARARVEIGVDKSAARGALRYELLFELPQSASFRVNIGSQHRKIDAKTAVERVAGSPLAHLHFEGAAGEPFEIDTILNAPRFYGLIAEGSEPGIVLDTSGIDGARLATALAWNADVLAAELRARRPELVVLAYGTNEAFDNRRAEIHGNEASELVSRLRRGAPNADCLILGPPDAAAHDFSSLPHVAEIEAALARAAQKLGCGFYSLRAAMGGDGSFARWMKESPQLARSDRVHFLPPGYERMGEALADALAAAYDRRKGR